MKANKIVAKRAWDSGKNKEGLRQYKIVAKYENNKEFQYFLANYYYKEYLNIVKNYNKMIHIFYIIINMVSKTNFF